MKKTKVSSRIGMSIDNKTLWERHGVLLDYNLPYKEFRDLLRKKLNKKGVLVNKTILSCRIYDIPNKSKKWDAILSFSNVFDLVKIFDIPVKKSKMDGCVFTTKKYQKSLN